MMNNFSTSEAQQNKASASRKGFTLFEIAIAVGVMVVIAVVSLVSLSGTKSNGDLTGTSQQATALLREAQSRSVSQTNGKVWGVHFDNVTAPFYALFSGAYSAASTLGKYPLPADVSYVTSTVPSGSSVEITTLYKSSIISR